MVSSQRYSVFFLDPQACLLSDEACRWAVRGGGVPLLASSF